MPPAKDDNGKPVVSYFGVSHRDGVTPVAIKYDSNGYMLIDTTTTIEFDPDIDAGSLPDDIPFAMATSSDDNTTIRPWVVNEDTGAVLIDLQ